MSEQQWTPTVGLTKALVSLTLRAIPAAILWCVPLWLAIPAINQWPRAGILVLGSAALLGLLVGVILSKGLSDRAGFVSPVLTLLAAGFALVVIVGGTAVAELLREPLESPHRRFLIDGVAFICALGWIVKATMFDE